MTPSVATAEVDARATPQAWAQPVVAPERVHAPQAASDVTIEVAGSARLAEIQADWRDLAARADVPNVFMHPILVALSTCYPNIRCRTLLAWQQGDGGRKLVGFWAFAAGRAPQSIIPLSVLAAPVFAHAYLSAPMIDRDALDETLAAMLDGIAADTNLPNIVALDAMREDSATMQALGRVLQARASTPAILRRVSRPMLESELDAKQYMEKALSGSTRKKLRQHRRRLGEKGKLESHAICEPEAVKRATEDFLRLEAAGWKGERRTALLCDAADATFVREMLPALAAQGEAAIHALTLDGRPVSMQIVLRAGPTAFTWKTAYDETLRDFSPGMLLLEDYTAALLADPDIRTVDSCCYDEGSFMNVWSERRSMVDLWFDARRGGSATFSHVSRLQGIYLRLRAQAKAAYLARQRKKS